MFNFFRTLSYLRSFIPRFVSGPIPRPHIAGLLIDISGTLQVGKTPTTDAVEAFQKLRKFGIPFRLCSNSSKESTASLVRHLDDMGFQISEAEKDLNTDQRLVWTSIGAMAQKVQDMGLHRPYLLLSPSAADEVKPPGNSHVSSDETTEHDSVVVGLDPASFNYDHLNTAFRILKGENYAGEVHDTGSKPRKNTPLIATHKAKYIQTESGLSMGPGPFVTALENASGIEAIIVGKPTKSFFEMAIRDLGEDSSNGRIVIIGDDVEADLGGGALDLNLWRVLVKTGKYRPGDEYRPGVTPPDEIFDSFAAFVDSLLAASTITTASI
ncbi:HAD-like domain-containing protein [Panaeolus papilionaceus]|nr:HAD-like domain-containing protein [Panaeolus papilionaceus]